MFSEHEILANVLKFGISYTFPKDFVLQNYGFPWVVHLALHSPNILKLNLNKRIKIKKIIIRFVFIGT